MPILDRITTGGGDKGETSLVDGSRVAKCSQRVCAYGTVDELNSIVGLVRCEELPEGLSEKICLILGNESKGVNDDLLEASDYCIHIPMLGMNSSMNVICAASIAVFEMSREFS